MSVRVFSRASMHYVGSLVHTHAHTHVRTQVPAHAHLCMHMSIHMPIRMPIRMRIRMCTHMPTAAGWVVARSGRIGGAASSGELEVARCGSVGDADAPLLKIHAPLLSAVEVHAGSVVHSLALKACGHGGAPAEADRGASAGDRGGGVDEADRSTSAAEADGGGARSTWTRHGEQQRELVCSGGKMIGAQGRAGRRASAVSRSVPTARRRGPVVVDLKVPKGRVSPQSIPMPPSRFDLGPRRSPSACAEDSAPDDHGWRDDRCAGRCRSRARSASCSFFPLFPDVSAHADGERRRTRGST